MKKKIVSISLLITVLLPFSGLCQEDEDRKIAVGFDKTVHLFFDEPVSYVNIGADEDVLGTLIDTLNIVRLVAAVPNFQETNLTVLTASHKKYAFTLVYDKNPKKTLYEISDTKSRMDDEKNDSPIIPVKKAPGSKELSKEEMAKIAKDLIQRTWKRSTSKRLYNIAVSLRRRYIQDGKLFLQLAMDNYSNIPYSISYIKFNVKGKKKLKKGTNQELPLTPIFVFSQGETIVSGNGPLYRVFVFDQFAMAPNKKLVIDIREKNGERNLEMTVPNSVIFDAEGL